MPQAVRARAPRPMWLLTVLVLVVVSASSAFWLTSTIDARERDRFTDEVERYANSLTDRLQGLEVIAAVLPLAMSPDLGGLSVESIETMLRGSDPAQAAGVVQAFTAFPLDGLAAFAFVDLTGDPKFTVLPSAGGLDEGVFGMDATMTAIETSLATGVPTTSKPIWLEGRPLYVAAMPIRGAQVAALAAIDARSLLTGADGLAAEVLGLSAADAGEGIEIVSTTARSTNSDLAGSLTVSLLGRRLDLTLSPSEAFDLQTGAAAGFSLFGLGMAIAVLVYVVGVMNRRRSEQQAEQLRLARQINDEKDRFIAAVSHELRTPLTAIVGISSEMVNRLEELGPAEMQELTELVATQSSEMSILIEDLLVAARADSGTITVIPEPIELGDQVRQVWAALQLHHQDTYISCEQEVWVLADGLRVRQIIRNLVTNAIRHGGPTLWIRSGESASAGWVEVSDDGPGVDEHSRELIFAPYYRAGRTKGLAPSVGLGLSVARQLAELMDGELEYVDETASTFRLTLPLAAVDAARPVA